MKRILIEKKWVIVGFIIAIILLVLGYMWLFTDTFKSKSEQFEKQFAKVVEQTEAVCDFSNEQQYIKDLQQKNYEDDTQIVVNYNDEQLNIGATGSTDNINAKSERNINITYGENNTSVLNMNFLKENDLYGVKFQDVLNLYVCINENELENVISNLSFKQEEVKDILLKISEIKSLINDTSENNVKSSIYSLLKETDKSQFEINNDRIITLSNSESVATTAYVLKLTTEQTKKVYDIIKENFEPSLVDKIIGEIKDDQETKITINSMENTIARAIIETGDIVLRVDFYDNSLNIKFDKNVENETQTSNIIITKEEGKKTIQYENNNDKIVIEQNILNSTNNAIDTTNITYSKKEAQNVQVNIKQTITLKDEVTIENSLNNQSKVVLNKLEKNTLNAALNNLLKRLQNKLNTVQNQVQSEFLKLILRENNDISSNYEEDVENEKKQFNSQFESYKGDSVEQNIVLNLIDTAKDYISNYQIVGEEKIKIYIDSNAKKDNDESEMITGIEEKVKENEKYKISFEYDNNSKISVIILDVITEEH